ncbi:ComF family protein [Pararhizobium mangrovi]|uniref:ComF family protein n=1 Tax=Pararhizobium mangrovi TaxID=2590452 RepID=A0A506U2R0_9HYPH|nr:ComF family protein [Pararhizobium mangrovi]TPW28652.1 ComF family protein [Pararhizobium mangrovi]
MDEHEARDRGAWERTGRGVRGVLGAMRDVVFPPVCLGCGARTAGHGALCTQCWCGLSFIEEPVCPVMGTPFSHEMGPGIVSPAALADPPRFDRARSALAYTGAARDLVRGLKYRDRTDLAPTMAAWMMRACATMLAEGDAIVAVPLHRGRLFARGFNQSAELARALARRAGVEFLPAALVRKRATRQQVGLTLAERRTNVRGAFAVSQNCLPMIVGRRIILVDDVYTTGATVDAATLALRRAGAAAVDVATFARVLDDHI